MSEEGLLLLRLVDNDNNKVLILDVDIFFHESEKIGEVDYFAYLCLLSLSNHRNDEFIA